MPAQRLPVREVLGAGLGAEFAPLTLQALPERHHNRAHHGFARKVRKLPGQPTRLLVLDVETSWDPLRGVVHDSGVTRDTRYDGWESEGLSWCHGAVQENGLVPKTEVGGMLKLIRGERPPTGLSEEALRFRCSFRRRFQSPATKVPFSEVAPRGSDFRFPASNVPFSEVADVPALSYGWVESRMSKEERDGGEIA